jgi:hypothetical protein
LLPQILKEPVRRSRLEGKTGRELHQERTQLCPQSAHL